MPRDPKDVKDKWNADGEAVADKIQCVVDGAHGIYVPQEFARRINPEEWDGISQENLDTLLSGPDHEDYWDAWDDVERDATMTDDRGRTWRLMQDGDLFMIREDYEVE